MKVKIDSIHYDAVQKAIRGPKGFDEEVVEQLLKSARTANQGIANEGWNAYYDEEGNTCLIDGNCRTEAMRRLGEDEVSIRIIGDLRDSTSAFDVWQAKLQYILHDLESKHRTGHMAHMLLDLMGQIKKKKVALPEVDETTKQVKKETFFGVEISKMQLAVLLQDVHPMRKKKKDGTSSIGRQVGELTKNMWDLLRLLDKEKKNPALGGVKKVIETVADRAPAGKVVKNAISAADKTRNQQIDSSLPGESAKEPDGTLILKDIFSNLKQAVSLGNEATYLLRENTKLLQQVTDGRLRNLLNEDTKEVADIYSRLHEEVVQLLATGVVQAIGRD